MNIYIKAMEIGFANPKGIRYKDLKDLLEEYQEFELEGEQEFAFVRWLINSYTTRSMYSTDYDRHLNDHFNAILRRNQSNQYELQYKSLLNSRFFMKGETVKQYLDYLELKESREQSKRAFQFSIGSIALALFSIVISWYLSSQEPQPPYDVKIIENKTDHIKLKNQIDSLENELGKAAMMIDIYEDDIINNKNKFNDR